jgi:hypothetical protein
MNKKRPANCTTFFCLRENGKKEKKKEPAGAFSYLLDKSRPKRIFLRWERNTSLLNIYDSI